MKRYKEDQNGILYTATDGEWVLYEDVKVTAITNYRLLETIRELQERLKKYEESS